VYPIDHVARFTPAAGVEDDAADMHALNQTVQAPLHNYPYEQLCPGGAAIDELMDELE